MLTDKDMKTLNPGSERQYLIIKYSLVVFILFQIFITINNFTLALNYAELGGYDFSQTLHLWNQDLQLEKNYSGYEVQSLYRLNMGIINFGVVLILILLVWFMALSRKRNKRIISELINCGAISKERKE